MTSSRASRLPALSALALAALLLLANAPGGGVPTLTDLRVGVHPDHTRIVIETDGEAPYVLDPGEREVLVHVDAAASAEALTASSPHLVWVKVEPTALGADVRIQLKQPVEVKTLVLERPDRIVLDLYPKTRAAQPQPQPGPKPEAEPEPLPAPELLPEPEAPMVAVVEPEPPAPEGEVGPDDEPGLPEEEAEEPLVLELPDGEPAEEPAPEAEARPEPEVASEPETPSEVSEGREVEPPAEPGAPTTPAVPAPSGSRFGSPYALGAAALVLLVLFVWLRRRLRRVEPRRFPALPEEDAEEFEPPQRAIAIGEEAESGESVFDVEPDALEPAEPVPTLRPLVRADADADDETERRLAHLEKRIEELIDAKDRLERQTAAQTEELRVQRAAIARTQRVLRSIAPKGDEEPSEPLVRG